MDKFNNDYWRNPAEKFKSLGHPVRLWIVHELADGERCVGEFVEKTLLDYSTISQHLTVLRQNNIISAEKRGKEVYYSLTCDCVKKFLDCIDANGANGKSRKK